MEKIYEALINNNNYLIEIRKPRSSMDSEPVREMRTNFDIGVCNRKSALRLREDANITFNEEGAAITYVCVDEGVSNYAICGGFGYIRRDNHVQKVVFERTGNIKSLKKYSAIMVFTTFEVAEAFANKLSLIFGLI